jgi:hypothetical protein
MKRVIWGRFVWVHEVFYVLEKTFYIQNLNECSVQLWPLLVLWVYMMMFCICRRRSRSRDRGNRKRSHSPADRHGSSRYKRSRSRERDRYVCTVTYCVHSHICLSVSNVWGLWGTSVNEEISETWTRNVEVHLKFQVCSFEPAMNFSAKPDVIRETHHCPCS